jgi:hypothetical protein
MGSLLNDELFFLTYSVVLVIGISNVAEEPIMLCQEILKSGKNIGKTCGNKVFENNVCKRHINKQ